MKEKNKNIILYIIGVLMLFVGLAVTTASTIIIISFNIKQTKYIDTTAVVIKYDKKENGLRSIIVEYNIDEKYYQITSKHYSKNPEKLDTKIKIKYNPENPGEIIWIDNNRNGKYLASGLILLAGDILIWYIINLKDKNKKETKSLEKNEMIENPGNIKNETVELNNLESNNIEINDVKDESLVKEEIINDKKEEKIVSKENETQTYNEPLLKKEEIPEIFRKEDTSNNEIKKDENIESNKEDNSNKNEVELPKLNISPIPYDMDSPRETVVSDVLEKTMNIPTIKKDHEQNTHDNKIEKN